MQSRLESEHSQDRFENTFGETIQFSLTSRTNLVGEYRYQMIRLRYRPERFHYSLRPRWCRSSFDRALNRSRCAAVNHFALSKNDGDSTSPYFEGSLEYARSNHSLNWTTSYGFEAPTEANASTRQTFRTGV